MRIKIGKSRSGVKSFEDLEEGKIFLMIARCFGMMDQRKLDRILTRRSLQFDNTSTKVSYGEIRRRRK